MPISGIELMINHLFHLLHFLSRHTGMLENFHNTLLSKALCFWVSSASAVFFNLIFFGWRDEAYRSRILLAVLDHNSHLSRLPKQNSDSSLQYHRRFRQQTKNWDVVRVLEKKQYEYMPQLLQQIVDHCTSSDYLMKNSHCAAKTNHPSCIQPTIANIVHSHQTHKH